MFRTFARVTTEHPSLSLAPLTTPPTLVKLLVFSSLDRYPVVYFASFTLEVLESKICRPKRLTPNKFMIIDVWSTGCVMAELMLGQPLFPGESGIDQLVEIIKVLGTPTREQIKTMNPNYMEHKFPQIKPHPFNKVLISERV